MNLTLHYEAEEDRKKAPDPFSED